jgi:hypothetical protein
MKSIYFTRLGITHADMHERLKGITFHEYMVVRRAMHEQLKPLGISNTYFKVLWSNLLKDLHAEYKYKPPYSTCYNSVREVKKRAVVRAVIDKRFKEIRDPLFTK